MASWVDILSFLFNLQLSHWSLLFQKLQSWIQLPNGNWELGKILATSATESIISLPDGKVSEILGIVIFFFFLISSQGFNA